MTVVAAVLFLFLIPWLLWWLTPSRPLRVVIIDRTVSDRSYREHRGLVWLLNYYKFLRPDGQTWDVTRDYVGFYPDRPGHSYSMSPYPVDVPSPDLVYWADTYGVYTAEWYLQSQRGGRSQLIEGGVKQESVDYAKRALEGGRAQLFAEFNTLNAPTEPGPRHGMEQLFSITWTGWTARWFDDLGSEDVPEWLLASWKTRTGQDWAFTGGGYVFSHDDGRLLVLKAGRNVGAGRNRLDFPDSDVARLGVTDSVPYLYWFDVVRPAGAGVVRARYLMDLTDIGRRTLDSAGIGTDFPAIIEGPEHAQPTMYFAGDWVDVPDVPAVFRYVGLAFLERHWPRGESDPATFFWKVYAPLMRTQLERRAAGAAAERDSLERVTDSVRGVLREGERGRR